MYLSDEYLKETLKEGRKINSCFTEAQIQQYEVTHKKNIPFYEYLSKMPENSIAPRGRCQKLTYIYK